MVSHLPAHPNDIPTSRKKQDLLHAGDRRDIPFAGIDGVVQDRRMRPLLVIGGGGK